MIKDWFHQRHWISCWEWNYPHWYRQRFREEFTRNTEEYD